jgi:hypothetical protein
VDEDDGFQFIFAPGEDYPIDLYRPGGGRFRVALQLQKRAQEINL